MMIVDNHKFDPQQKSLLQSGRAVNNFFDDNKEIYQTSFKGRDRRCGRGHCNQYSTTRVNDPKVYYSLENEHVFFFKVGSPKTLVFEILIFKEDHGSICAKIPSLQLQLQLVDLQHWMPELRGCLCVSTWYDYMYGWMDRWLGGYVGG